jgi:NAD(P)-dependent dehydrogenase (short-subunit alcohol dehydrogenase family)
VSYLVPRAREQRTREGDAVDRFGRVDILVNNAGNAIPKPFVDFTDLPPEKVAPPVVYLVHESCRLNGVVLSSSGGQVGRMVLARAGEGFASAGLTPEDVRDNIDRIVSLDQVVASGPVA